MRTIRFRDTLLARILGGFLLNLILVGAGLWGLYRFQMGPASPLAGLSEERVRHAAAALSDQLISAPRTHWLQIVQRHSERHRVEFHLCHAHGGSLLEDDFQADDAVQTLLNESFSPVAVSPVRRHLTRQFESLHLSPEQLGQIETIWLESLRQFRQTPDPQAAVEAYNTRVRAVLSDHQRTQFAALAPRHLHPLIATTPTTPAEWLQQADRDANGELNAAELATVLNAYAPPTPQPAVTQSLPVVRPAVFTRSVPGKRQVWAALEIPVRVPGTGPPFSSWDVADLRAAPDHSRYNAILLMASNPMDSGSFFAEPWPWLTILLLVLGLSILFWLPLVRRITRPLAEVTDLTEQIAEGRFQNRVGLEQRGEIGRLAHAVDQMAERLQGLVGGQRRFLGDVAHELCAPLARVQMALCVLAQTASPEQQEELTDLQEEVEQMAALVDELLFFTRTGAHTEPRLEPVPLRDCVEQALCREAPGLSHHIDVPEAMHVNAAPDRLARALGNLARNAEQYAQTGGTLEVRAQRQGDAVELTFADRGPGVSAENLPQLFDPFYRPEISRSPDTGGTGLGLAIVKSTVESCGGTVRCRIRNGGGLEFTLRLSAVD
ncbi:MAG: HAMP domain-containing histidine kinase [Verrucomicrobia subdivision 3 bacterium]|nr:HAMP domain-containing histidine kinase [Limisphaerales bacterium]